MNADLNLYRSSGAGSTAMTDLNDLGARIRTILKDHGRLSIDALALGSDDDLYQAGMTSHASVNVMLALEGAFDIEFPDQMLTRAVFNSVGSIQSAVAELIAA
jgi:acyl carrier protein